MANNTAMKKIILLLFSVVFLINLVQAQINPNIIDTNKVWNALRDCHFGSPPNHKYKIWLKNDTIIDSLVYKKAYCEGHPVYTDSIIGYIREDNRKIFFIYQISAYRNDWEEELLYDFNLEKNDSTIILGHIFKVNDVDTVDINGNPIKRITFSDNDEYWLEGIGSNFGLISVGNNVDTGACDNSLICFKENEFEYVNEEFSASYCDLFTGMHNAPNTPEECKIIPNPAYNNAPVKVKMPFKDHFTINIYASSGQKAKTTNFYGHEYYIGIADLPKGIYLYSVKNNKNFNCSGIFIKY
jgi:hypothetical protein